ncbi:MAG: TrkH family potassium uptake protein [Dehalobacterium sp.]
MIFKRKIKLAPPQILSLGFIIMILLGTILLTLPISTTDGKGCSWLNALFTSTSATCVTGLIVVDTGTYFSRFGQVVIAALIQVGGLGFMSMSVLIALALGKRIMLKERLIIQEALNQINMDGIIRLTKYMLGVTFLIEGTAALFLAIRWSTDLGWGRALYYGVFHAISAFCNAGFDLFSVSFVNYRGDLTVNLVISLLFIIGGIGITVILDIGNYFSRHKLKLSLHSKMVLSISAILILIGMAMVFLMESNNTLAGISWSEKILASYFQAVTPRTAGFNTLPIGEMRDGTLFFLLILMFIGASPGSTGGGIKTTTFGTVFLLIISIIKGKNEVKAFERSIPNEIVYKALTILIISLGIVIINTTILLFTETADGIQVLFEVVSAFGTVGLSTGITPTLSSIGKIIIIFTMFLGRVGPLTLAFALTQRMRKGSEIRHPEEKINVG